MASLHISPTLDLPDDFATESIGIVGIRGSGKSNTGVVLAEEMWDAQIPWVAIDPKGDWHGIRSSADGQGPGLEVVVFGGLHGDLPLEHTAGALVADLLVDHNLTAVLDVSRFSGAQLSRFLVDFCHRLFWRHQEEPHVRHVFLEEAHRYIPQQVTSATAAMKEACAKIPLEGRAFGLGSSTMTQRPARLHKDVTTQFGTVVAMRVMAKQDRDALGGWFLEQEVGVEALATLSTLKPGEGWVLSPLVPLFERVFFRQRRTFDSGATPKVGQARRKPATVADVDLAAIGAAMADTIEKAKADDPKELRKQLAERDRMIGDLERQLAERPDVEPEVITVDVAVLGEAGLRAISLLVEHLDRCTKATGSAVDGIIGALGRIEAGEQPGRQDVPGARATGDGARAVADRDRTGRASQRADPPLRRDADRPTVPRPAPTTSTTDLPAGEAKILTAIAQYPDGVTREQLSVLTGYKKSSRDTYLQRLRTRGFIETGSTIRATDEGRDALGDEFEPLPTGEALQEHWLATLPEGERRILVELLGAYPAGVSRDDLSDATGYKKSSRDTYLQRMRSRQLVTTDGDPRAADVLFEEARRG
ncbi:MAG: hypothetical protein JWN67_5014 [Actinomycetia bacterium]|nr:hypothetical protein [Actinomycetes bacterium]